MVKQALSKSYNLKKLYPKIAKEWDFKKNTIDPSEVTHGSKKKYWWICSENHSYLAPVGNRTLNNAGCPYCTGKAIGYGNDFKSQYPKLAKEWDINKNSSTPDKVFPNSNKYYWWKCKKGHTYKQRIATKTFDKKGCPYCSNYKVGYGNDLQTLYPELAKEWDYKKNKKSPSEVVPNSYHNVWWICKKGHSFNARIYSRTILGRQKKGTDCSFCTSQKIGYGNDLKSLYPKISKEWNYEKNILKPEDTFPFSNKKVWWICIKGHTYETTPYNRTKEISGCPYCTIRPRSKEEIYLLFELKEFFDINENDHKIKLDKIYDVDIKLKSEKVIIEYDGSYWHLDKVEKDKIKTNNLRKNGWIVIRVREKPLKIISRKFNVSSNPRDYKNTANNVLKKLKALDIIDYDISKYLNRKSLANKKNADQYINKITK